MRNRSIISYLSNGSLILLCAACLFPFLLLFMASVTDESVLIQDGYSLFPGEFSFAAYVYLIQKSASILHAYGITIAVTVIGTIAGLLITTMLAYPLSRRDMPLRSILSLIVVFTMLFNGGLVSTYLVYTTIFHIKNTMFGLLIPGLLTNGFYILLVRTFFRASIPFALIESAFIDGASEFTIFRRIVLPLSLPILATIALMLTIGYWNDWFNGLIYVTDSRLFSIQNLLNRMLSDAQYLQQMSTDTGGSDVAAQMPLSTVRMAMAAIGIIPILMIYPFFQRFFVKGLTIGSVKG